MMKIGLIDVDGHILARFVNKDDEFIEAYAIVYGALKKFDEAGEQE